MIFSTLTIFYMACICLKSSVHTKIITREELFNSEYSAESSQTFAHGKFFLGTPEEHSCIQKSFSVPDGRLICAQTPTMKVSCFAQCKRKLFLRTGYKDGIETPENKLSTFGVYNCDPKNQGYWTDINGVKLSLPGPWCDVA